MNKKLLLIPFAVVFAALVGMGLFKSGIFERAVTPAAVETTGVQTESPKPPATTEQITDTAFITTDTFFDTTETGTETETETETTAIPFDNGCDHKLKTKEVEGDCHTFGYTLTYCTKCGYEKKELTTKVVHKQVTAIVPDKEGNIIEACRCLTCGYTDEGHEYTSYELHFGEEIGLTREKLVKWLKSHENDEYYIGTIYQGYAYAFPQGAANYSSLNWRERAAAVEAAAMYVPANETTYKHNKGWPGMNCAGLVAHACWSCCPDFLEYFDALAADSEYLGFEISKGQRDWSATNAILWHHIVTRNTKRTQQSNDKMGRYIAYKFPSKKAMLSSGVLKKGDILFCSPQYSGEDMHLGIYWGDDSTSDIFWVSELQGVEIKDMYPHESGGRAEWYVLPLLEENPDKWHNNIQKTAWEIVKNG